MYSVYFIPIGTVDNATSKVYIMLLKTLNKDLDIDEALKKAVADFINTDEGKEIYEKNGNSFTMKNIMYDLPDHICIKYGFIIDEVTESTKMIDWNKSFI